MTSSDSDEVPPDNRDESDSSSGEESDKKPSGSKSKGKKHHRQGQEKTDETVEQLAKDIAAMKIYLMKPDSSRKKCFNCQKNGHEAPACTSPCKLCQGQEGNKGHAYFNYPRYKPKSLQADNFLISQDSGVVVEGPSYNLAVKRGHETATSDPTTAHEVKRVRVAELIRNALANKPLTETAQSSAVRQELSASANLEETLNAANKPTNVVESPQQPVPPAAQNQLSVESTANVAQHSALQRKAGSSRAFDY